MPTTGVMSRAFPAPLVAATRDSADECDAECGCAAPDSEVAPDPRQHHMGIIK